jgi:predicted nucleic acid-binding protein
MQHVKSEYLALPLDDPVLVRARDLVTRYPVRTLDAIQLASALEASITLGESMTFISGDNTLLSTAAVLGFTTDNPYAHP